MFFSWTRGNRGMYACNHAAAGEALRACIQGIAALRKGGDPARSKPVVFPYRSLLSARVPRDCHAVTPWPAASCSGPLSPFPCLFAGHCASDTRLADPT